MDEKYLSRKDLAARWNISLRTLDRWIRSKNIPHYRSGLNNRILFTNEEIEEWEAIYMPKLGRND